MIGSFIDLNITEAFQNSLTGNIVSDFNINLKVYIFWIKNRKEEISLELPSNSLIAVLVGHHNINLVKLEKLIGVNINLFGNHLIFQEMKI